MFGKPQEDRSRMFDLVEEMFDDTNDAVKTENANKDHKIIPTRRDLLAGIVSKEYALKKLLPEHIAQAHESGDIHFHDLDYSPFFPMFNCMLIDIENMLSGGYKMGNAEIETPKSITTACAQVAQIIAQVASHIYGGNSINRIDEVLAPYVRKSYDKHLAFARKWMKGDHERAAVMATEMVEKETHNAFQALEFEINTLHCANGQTPFTTLNFGLGTSWESRLIQQSILNIRMEGLGKNKRTAVFPKLVFGIRDGINHKPGDINYDIKKLALKCASERMYPDILNYDKLVEFTGGYKAPMGCRSFLNEWQNEDGEAVYNGRNNLGVVSVNLPRIAIENPNLDDFWRALDQRLELAKEALDLRIERLEHTTADVAPILYCEGAAGVRLKPTDKVAEIFKHGRASISLGYIGIHECVTELLGNDDHTFDNPIKQELAKKIVTRLREATDKWKAESEYAYSLYSTPSESLCDRFCRLDVKKFGEIPGVTDKGYYTNSFHLDVFKKVNPFEKIQFEQDYHGIAVGGFISYVEFPNMKHNLEGLEAVWDWTYDKLAYFGTNTPVDYCGACDYSGEAKATEEGFVCPSCGNNDPASMSVTRRVCGYLGSPNARPYNPGKQKEVIGRVKHYEKNA